MLGRVGEKTSCVYWRGSGNPLLVLEFVSLSFLLRKGRKFFSQVPGCPWCLWEGSRGLAYVATLGIMRTAYCKYSCFLARSLGLSGSSALQNRVGVGEPGNEQAKEGSLGSLKGF